MLQIQTFSSHVLNKTLDCLLSFSRSTLLFVNPPPQPAILPFDTTTTYYEAGELVTNKGKIWRCKSWPWTWRCSQDGYAPGVEYNGEPLYLEAWEEALVPTASPSHKPSSLPSAAPSYKPSSSPSAAPSTTPSESPSANPSSSPSEKPSLSPSASPSYKPSSSPSAAPSTTPSASPSDVPSASPSAAPSHKPSASPSAAPSNVPSGSPSTNPSSSPSEGVGGSGIGSVRSTNTTFSTATCNRDATTYTRSFTSADWPGSSTLSVTGLGWSDWGGDIFDGWGSFYLWDGVATNPTAIAPPAGVSSWATEMNAAAENGYYTFETTHNGNTFETTYAWRDSGTIMFQVICTSDRNLNFYVGGGGNMGSDSTTVTNLLSYSASISGVGPRTIQYIENFQSSNTIERFYIHGFPVNDVGTTWALNYHLTGSDNMFFWTGAWKGATLYFSKYQDPIAAISGDIAAGVIL